MRTILFTGYDDAYEDLAAITVPRMHDYARRHKIESVVFRAPPPELNMYWTGVARGRELLTRYGFGRVLYLDVDQLITNMDKPPTCDPAIGLHIGRDWGEDAIEPWQFSACGWFAHAGCINMFEDVLKMAPEWADKPFQEQGPWQEWVKEELRITKGPPRTPPRCHISFLPRCFFNNVPDEVCPGKVPEPWKPGDFAAHLTMLPLGERVELAKKILSKVE